MSYGLSEYGAALYGGPRVEAPSAADTFPFLSLEWSPTTGPRDTPAWLQIPLADIRSIDLNRGRNRELDQFQAGRMTVVLDNRVRTYDPEVDSNVKPMRRIRLRATLNSVTYDLFSGYVDSWDQDYDMTQEARAVVTATDGFKVLSEAEMLSSAYAEEVQADAPAAWWRCDEGTGSDFLFDVSGNGFTLTAAGTPTFGANSLNDFDSDTAVTLAANTDGFQNFSAVPLPANGSCTVEFLVNTTDGGGGTDNIVGMVTGGLGFGFALDLVANRVRFGVVTAAGAAAPVSTSVINDGVTHHIVCAWEAGGTASVYVDGTLEDTATNTGTSFGSEGYIAIGAGTVPTSGGSTLTVEAMTGTYDEVAIYDYAFTQADVTRHHDALIAPWNGDTTGERIDRVLDAIGWPTGDRDVDAGESTLQSANLDESALDHAQKVRDVEFGELFMLPNGNVRFVGRHNKWLPPYNDPLFTLSDDGSDLAYGAIKFNFDDQLIRNRVTIGYENGLTYTANSTASQDDFYIKSYSKTGLIGDVDSEAVDYASYILSRYKDPLLRAQSITIHPQRDPDVYFPAVLAADLVYQINVERTPQGTGNAIDIDYTIEGVQHHIEPKLWRTELQLSPADTPGAFILNSTSQGVLDTNFLGW